MIMGYSLIKLELNKITKISKFYNERSISCGLYLVYILIIIHI